MVKIDKLVRSKRRTLSVSVNVLGEVTVHAPMRAKESEIDAFIASHEDWIRKKQVQRKAVFVQLPSENLDGYALCILGEKYTLRLYAGERIALDNDSKYLFLPQNDARRRLIGWLKDNALRICTSVTERKAREMGVQVASVSVTSASSFWGICTAQNALRFTYRLLYAPKAVIEYVVVHELAHVRHKNHSPAFWREVEKYAPDWKIQRKWLKDRAILMEIF